MTFGRIASVLCVMCMALTTAVSKPYVVLLSTRATIVDLPQTARYVIAEPVAQAMLRRQSLLSASSGALGRLLRYAVVDLTPEQARALADSTSIENITPLGTFKVHELSMSDDSLSASQYALPIVGASKAWPLATGKGILVGVLDTGLDWEHPDLRTQLSVNVQEDLNHNGTFEAWPSTQEYEGVFGDLDGIDNDGNGYADDVIGYDFVHQTIHNLGDDADPDGLPSDEQGHGTSVSGVIAATANNGIGIAGLAYGARIVVLRAFDATGNAEEDDIAAALVYAAANGINVVNMSFGDGVDSPVLRDAITFAAESGCVLVSSAGNSGLVSRQFPAGYDQVIAVGSTNSADRRSVFSSTGSLVDLVAPGEAIVTTAVGGRYRTVSGTSFSAPLVAASAAMLLEQRPSITAQQIQGILTETSIDLGLRGWDGEYGAGRLQVDAALRHLVETEVHIATPRNEQELVVRDGDSITVTGWAYASLFESLDVYIGRGVEPQSWTSVHHSNKAVVQGTICKVGSADLPSGDIVLRLVVNLKTGRWLESRRRLRIVTTDTLHITAAEVVPAWNADLRVGVVSIRTDRPTQLTLINKPDGSMADTSVNDLRFTRSHCTTIDNDVRARTGSVTAIVRAASGDTASFTTRYDLDTTAMPLTGFKQIDNGEFAGYVLDDVRDVRSNGNQAFLMSNLQSGSFGPLNLVERRGFDFVATDSTRDIWIPRGMGDANGNGLLEAFVHVVGKAVLFEQKSADDAPFSTVVFADTMLDRNAAAMADVDGDGHEDLIMLSDSGCTVMTFKNGTWQQLGSIVNTTPPAPGNADNRIDEVSVACADFDGNGRTDIAFADNDGDLVIAEYTPSGFVTTFSFESEGVGGSGYVACGDVDGDGKADILLGVPDNPYADEAGDYGRQTWTYRLFSAKESHSYGQVWTDKVYGVRYGIGYRNGLSVAEVNGVPGDELIICAFPRLFVFTWDSTRGVQPLLYQPLVVTPRFLTHDFNGNGVAELGFGTTVGNLGLMTDFRFIEFTQTSSQLPTPAGVVAKLITPLSVKISWMPVPKAARYYVYRRTGTELWRLVDTTTSTSVEYANLELGQYYQYRVSAIASGQEVKDSERSAIVGVQTGASLVITRMQPETVSVQSLASGAQLRLQYNGKLSPVAPDPHHFALANTAEGIVARGRSVSLVSESELLVSFDPLPGSPASVLVTVEAFPDKQGIPTQDAQLLLGVVNSPNASILAMASLEVVSNTELLLTYTMPVTESALNVAAYSLSPMGMVQSIERAGDSTVHIHLSTNPPLAALGTTYTLSARDVVSTTSIPLTTGTGSKLSFVLVATELDNVFVYPHPVSAGSDGFVTFANLTQNATVEVLDISFKPVRTLHEQDGNGGLQWDLRTTDGSAVPPGMYYYRVSGSRADGATVQSGLKKILIRR